MASFATIRTAIDSKLKTMSTIDAAKVVAYGTVEPTGFPFCTIEHMGAESESIDECNNFRTYMFRVRVYISMDKTQGGIAWSETALTAVLDEIIDLFDNDYTLGGAVDNIEAVEVTCGYSQFEAGTARTAEIILKARKLYTLI